MSARKPQLDTEEELLRLLDTAQKRKHIFEMQLATYGELHTPPYVKIALEAAENEVIEIQKRLSAVRRRNRREDLKRHFLRMPRNTIGTVLPKRRPRKKRKTTFSARVQNWFTVVGVVSVVILAGALYIWLEHRARTVIYQFPPLTSAARELLAGPGPEPPSKEDLRIVANTGGIGVLLRYEPRQDSPSEQGPLEGARVFVLEELIGADGDIWCMVRLENGSIGYIKGKYLTKT